MFYLLKGKYRVMERIFTTQYSTYLRDFDMMGVLCGAKFPPPTKLEADLPECHGSIMEGMKLNSLKTKP